MLFALFILKLFVIFLSAFLSVIPVSSHPLDDNWIVEYNGLPIPIKDMRSLSGLGFGNEPTPDQKTLIILNFCVWVVVFFFLIHRFIYLRFKNERPGLLSFIDSNIFSFLIAIFFINKIYFLSGIFNIVFALIVFLLFARSVVLLMKMKKFGWRKSKFRFFLNVITVLFAAFMTFIHFAIFLSTFTNQGLYF